MSNRNRNGVSVRQMGKAAGIKFPYTAVAICRNCRKTFTWKCYSLGSKVPTYCEKHNAGSFVPQTHRKTCLKCGGVFMWKQKKENATAPVTCLVHRSEDERFQKSVCKTPNKNKFSNRTAAQKYVEEVFKTQRVVLRPYPCPCGSWHVTSQVSAGQAKIKNALG